MSITLLDLYNKVASQSWSMFDNDAKETEDFDPVLLTAINKALVEIWCSYPFDFRKTQKEILTQKYINKYNLPDGSIISKNTKNGEKYSVMCSRKYLEFIEYPDELDFVTGKPEGFFIKNDKLSFYPAPDKMYKIVITYLTFAVGVDAENKQIYALRDAADKIVIPEKYEQLFVNALISKSMMYALSSPSDENYLGYNIQFEKAYKLLLNAVGGRRKSRKIIF
ncbi:MAG: hypothetical protein K6E29_00790 [Cyanobacteria bacterium RUI128]|nr:hypothetical protein [Cyanobacteria bacterium RUI128]